MPRRKDATYVYDVQPFKKLFPYLMPRKCDSLVYLSLDLDLTKTLDFIKNHPSVALDRKYRVFEILIAAVVRLIVLRPELNRFWMNKKLWQRNEISINFIAKENHDDTSAEHNIVLNFDSSATLETIAKNIDEGIKTARESNSPNSSNTANDRLVNIFTSFPPIILSTLVNIIKFLDIKGIAPLSFTREDGLHCSAYLTNLGSIGLNNSRVYHHLYQWGNTSLFITIGALKRQKMNKETNEKREDKLQMGLTIDERIADGYYLVQSLKVLQDLLNNPEQLLFPPVKVQDRPVKNRKEYKKLLKQQNKKQIS